MTRRQGCGSRSSATGRWAQMAHIPGWQRDPRVEVVALADVDAAALAAAAGRSSGCRR